MTPILSLSGANVIQSVDRMLPGCILVLIVTAAAFGFRQIPGLHAVNPMFIAILIGVTFANVTSVPRQALPGIEFLGKKLLRFAVALLGLQLTLAQVFDVGATGMLLLAAVVVSTYGFTLLAGRLLGIDPGLTRLLAAGTSICGASAIAAANAAEQAADEDVSYAIACITLFGTLAIVIYPMLASLLDMGALDFGFWTGASVHEVAQVVVTGFQRGAEAGELSVVVKLSRVLLLAPLLVTVALLVARRKRATGSVPLGPGQILPFFVLCFILLMLAHTAGLVPESARRVIVEVTPVMLTAALGALGLGTSFSALRERGSRPLLLAALATVFISSSSLLMLPLLG